MMDKRRRGPSGSSPSEVSIWISSWTCQRKLSTSPELCWGLFPLMFPYICCSCFTSVLFCSEQLMELMHARARRRFTRGLKRKPMALVKKLRKAKKEAQPNEKPDVVKTHLRNMIIVPEMVGSIVGVYNGKTFNLVEIKVTFHQTINVLNLLCVLLLTFSLLFSLKWLVTTWESSV